jgi:phage baseplate assembly protein W
MPQNIFYSDLHIKLKKDLSQNITIVKDAESVRQSIKMILSTFPGERIMEPEFGSRVRELLFEPLDDITSNLLRSEIRDAIEKWENRVSVSSVDVNPNYDSNYYDVMINMTVLEIDADVVFEGKIRVIL